MESTEIEKFVPRELPTLAELHHDIEIAYKNDKLNLLLNQPVHAKWVKTHPIVTVKGPDGKQVKMQYLPTDKIKFLLTRIFQEWKNEILQVQHIFNSVVVTVRLHYRNPITGEWNYKDGVGAVGVQTDGGFSATDFSALKFDGVMKAAPAAESYALKNAAKKLGRIFGSELNKWDTAAFKPTYLKDGDNVIPIPPPVPAEEKEAPYADQEGDLNRPKLPETHFEL